MKLLLKVPNILQMQFTTEENTFKTFTPNNIETYDGHKEKRKRSQIVLFDNEAPFESIAQYVECPTCKYVVPLDEVDVHIFECSGESQFRLNWESSNWVPPFTDHPVVFTTYIQSDYQGSISVNIQQ